MRVRIEMGDPQALTAGVELGDAACKEGARGGEAIKCQRRFGTLIPHAHRISQSRGMNDANRVGFGG